jgi:large subunit ribosomal protein L21
MIAVIETRGKQYCLTEEQPIAIDWLDAEAGTTVEVNNVLDGKPVTVEVVEHILGKKVVSRKFRNKTRYQRVIGHRQPMTIVRLHTGTTTQSTEEKPKRTATKRKTDKTEA